MKLLPIGFTLICAVITTFSFAQSTADSTTLKALDAQIWRPFIQHYASFNTGDFNKLHTKNVLRGGLWGFSNR